MTQGGEDGAREGAAPRRLALLIVEDVSVTAFMLEGVLGAQGHRVIGTAASAEQALRLVQRERPDLALVDLVLQPGGSGIDLARELRRDGIPVLFLTGHPELARQHSDLALGWIEKPFSPTMVGQSAEALSAVLAGHPPEHLPFGLHLFPAALDEEPDREPAGAE